jgi:two-component system, OmpR family, sensor kinase
VSLRKRLTVSMAVVLVVALAVANTVTYSSLRSFLYGRLDDQIDGAQLQAYRYLTHTRPELLARLHGRHGLSISAEANELDARVSPDLYVMVVSHTGKVIVPETPNPYPGPRPLVPKSLRPAPYPRSHHYGVLAGAYQSEPDSFDVGSVGHSGVHYREALVNVPQGVLVVAAPLNSTTATLSSLLRIQILASLSVLAVLCAVVLVTLRRGLRPLETMAETTDAIAAGDLAHRVAVGRAGSEVARLSRALNAMLARIEEAFAQKSMSERRLRQFVADASHELRTPLTSIRGYTELLRKGVFTDQEGQDRALQRVEREAARMGLLVDDLLLLARLDQGRPLDQVPVDLTRVAGEAVLDARAVDPSRPVDLLANGAVWVSGDRDRLRQVAHNLVRNALDHTPQGTPVVVRVHRDAALGYLEVTDRGPGLRPEAAAKAFDRFWRDDAARTGGGSGLGLSIVRAIAEALGGSATVRSVPGSGATFEVAIPLDSGTTPAEPATGVEHARSERVRT